jgi:hypothetical protein
MRGKMGSKLGKMRSKMRGKTRGKIRGKMTLERKENCGPEPSTRSMLFTLL